MTSFSRKPRDPRIDFFRGVALLIVFVDHIVGNPVREFTPGRMGFSDMAEVFLFLSGYVCGSAYLRVLVERGFWACQKKALARAFQIYVVNLSLSWLFIAAVLVWNRASPTYAYRSEPHRCAAVLAAPHDAISRILALGFEPQVLAVLPLYILLLCCLPLMLALGRRHPGAMLAASATIYAAVQFFPESLVLPEPWRTAWFFNPLAWQLVFFCGVAWGAAGDWAAAWVPRSLPWTVAALAGLQLAFCEVISNSAILFPGAAKANCEPLRLLHFSCLLILARALFLRDSQIWRSRLAAPLVACGRNSLTTYCVGGFLATAGTILLPILEFQPGGILLVNGIGCILLSLLALGLDYWNRPDETRSSPANTVH
jgi:hypothetical protein